MNAGARKISIVIVGYNAVEHLTRCLDALLGSGRPSVDHEVIVVDNASRPPLASVLGTYRGRIRLITMGENVGFARGCNMGRHVASGSHLLLLNPDAVVAPGAVDALVEFLDADPGRGIVGGRTLTPNGQTDPRSCWGQPSWWSLVCFATGLSTAFPRTQAFDPESLGRWPRDTEREVGVVTGCLLLMTRALWDELGGLDPDFFMYGEDVDLCRRAIKQGYRPSITPRAEAVHAWGASSTSTEKAVMVMRGKATLNRKSHGQLTERLATGLLLQGVLLRAVLERLTRGKGPWSVAWARRAEWRSGWPPLSADQIPQYHPDFVEEEWELSA